MTEPTILYNGSCPVCATGAKQYRQVSGGDDPCGWVDIAAQPEALETYGLTEKAVIWRVHCLADGKMLRGMPAVAAILERNGKFRWVAMLSRLPVLRWFANASYEIVAAPLYVWNLWRRKRARR